MAGSEGSGQTELLSGWSCVVHRPSEDPEPSELPSTVDMAAFSSGLSVEPTQNTNNEDSCDSESDSDSDSNNSGSDVSGSCSQSDSSDSESSSSSQGSSSRSSSPEFSVTSSQTNGLRLKIATVRKSCTSPTEKPKAYSDVKVCDKNAENSVVKSCNLSSSSESPCSRSSSDSSTDSEAPSTSKSDVSDSKVNEKNASVKKPVAKVRLKHVEKKPERRITRAAAVSSPKAVLKMKTRPKRTQKMASLPVSRGSTGSSSDSEDGSVSDRTMLASCSLQEIRQEDLAAILPDQQECDAFGGFDCRPDKSSPHTGDGSGSDMELPQQAVNALIQRTTESSSESESRLPLNPNTLYANSLLQQFVAQTQMLNAPSSAPPHAAADSNLASPLQINTDNLSAPAETESTKRKRGRPRKAGSHKAQTDPKPDKTEPSKSLLNLEYCGNPNVSPDSGIQNSSDHVSSPEPSPTPNSKAKFGQEGETKRNTPADTKHTSKNAGDSRSNSNSRSASSKSSPNKLKEQPKLPVTSNSFDRVLYGNADRVLYPPRRKVGRPPITRKGPGRPPKHKPVSATISEEVKPPDKIKVVESDIKANVCPSKQSSKQTERTETKSNKSKKNHKNSHDKSSHMTNSNQTSNTVKKDSKEQKFKDVHKKSKSALLHEICERVSKRLDISNKYTQRSETKQETNGKVQKSHKGIKSFKKGVANRVVLGSKNKLDPLKAKYTTLKNSKVMHSRHKDKKHKKCKFKILKPISATLYDPKLNTEIDKLIADFVKLCNISSSKPAKENVPEMLKVLKKASKKRKASDYTERKKKKQNVSSSFNKEPNSNEQRLPLKKRHYHLSTNNDSVTVTSQTDTETDSKPKLPSSTKDTKSPSTTPSNNNKVVTDKIKCIGKSIASTNNITTARVPAINSFEQNVLDLKPCNNTSPKASNLNNNDYTTKPPKSGAVGVHIDEAIEACITRYSSVTSESVASVKVESTKNIKPEFSPKEQKLNTSSTSLTTPKKRHRLEARNNIHESTTVNDVIAQTQPAKDEKAENSSKLPKSKNIVLETVACELRAKKNLSPNPVENKLETVAQIITRKKNRLEDLTLTLAHKVNSTSTGETTDNHPKRKKDVTKAEEVSVDNLKRKKELKVEEPICIDNQKRSKKEVKAEEVTVETSHKRKKEIAKAEVLIVDCNQKRRKEVAKTEEVIIDTSQKRRKEVAKTEELILDNNQKRRKEVVKTEDVIVDNNQKRRKEVAKTEEVIVDTNHKRRKEVAKTEELILDNNQKRRKEVVKTEDVIVDNNQKRRKEVAKTEELIVDTSQKRRKEVAKTEELIFDNSQKRRKEVVKTEDVIVDNTQKRRKEVAKTEEVIVDTSQKRRKEVAKTEELILDTNQKRRKEVVKTEEVIVDSNQKRRKEVTKAEEVVDTNQKRRKEVVKTEGVIVDNNHKRRKEVIKSEEVIVDSNQKRRKEVAKAEEVCVDNQKRRKEVPKTEDIIVDNNQKRKKEVAKTEEAIIDNQKRRKEVLKIEELILDNNQKRRKDVAKMEEIHVDNGQKRKKEVVKIEEIVVDNQKRKKEIAKTEETVNDCSQKRKKEIAKAEEATLDISQKRKKEIVKLEEPITRASVIKSPVSKRVKPAEPEKLDSITADKPTGIFMPTIDIELQIPASKIQTAHASDKLNLEPQDKILKIEEPSVLVKSAIIKDCVKSREENETKKASMPDNVARKKIRKRRAFNRTGFPTVKKKKKRTLVAESIVLTEAIQQQPEDVKERTACDRVPQEGEKYSAFLQRTEKLNVSTVILEKLQKSVVSSKTQLDEIPKWDPLQEEDSMHELGVLSNGRPSSRLSMKQSRSKDVSPAASIDTLSSDRNCDLDELSLEARLELFKISLTNKNVSKTDLKWRTRRGRSLARSEKCLLQKRRLRDVSPASSIEPFYEKKLREEVSVSGDEAKRTKKAPRWRKKYLLAGLFSDYYKEDDEAVRIKRTEAASKSRVIYNPQEHPYGLLPPPYHCGKYLRCRKITFQLPYDLWWQHTNSQLPGRDIVPSWNYRKVRTNVYNVRITAGACEPQACNCCPASGCGDDCINRLVLSECPATHKCQNQKIQKHEWAPGIEKFMTTDKGWGVRTKLPIKAGEFILEYVGEVVSDQEFKERMASRYAHDTHHYCLHLDGGLVIDGHRMGGDGRFVNHSCEPNCEMQKWSVNGQFRMALFALRDIDACEELTYDYNFSLFNPAEGQVCKCGSINCRGVIGGKSQRVRQSTSSSHSGSSAGHSVGRVGRPRKNQAKRTTSGPKEPPVPPVPPPIVPTPLMKPLSNSQRLYVREHHCFLLRNLNKAKQNRERSVCSISVTRANAATPTDHNATTFMNHLNALRQPRNIKTRRLAQAEDNPELKKTAQLASILRDLLNVVITTKDEKSELLCTTFMSLPSKRKVPEYYQRITEPIDMTTIEQNIATGVYRTVENFDGDMNRIFVNAVRFFGRTSEPGIAATRLKKIYCECKQQSLSKLEAVIGVKLPPTFVQSKRKGEEEDVIRCICGMFRDEGLMIQCERCLVWQHCECVQADAAAASYHCERCVPRHVDYEIALDEYTEHGHRYYMTLLRGDLQLRQGDTVYVLRDIPIPGTDRKHTYDTINEIKYTDLDIFRIERLWKDCKSGQRFAYGHHYLRPHETFHEPTRKFFSNEVMRVPLYEAVPVDLVISHCWVFDLNTYCKGRPIGAPEEHIYICEYRVDKSARLFSKISKSKYPVCTKTYAFERFDVRLKISRTYTPHDLDPLFVKPRGRKPQENDDMRELPQLPVHVPVVRTRSEKKTRLNKIMLALLNKMPTKQALDVSYLLEGGRRRKKQVEK